MLGSPYHRIFWKNQNLMYTIEPCLTELWSTETQVKRKSFEINKKAKLTLKHPCNTETMHYRWPLPRAPQPRCWPPMWRHWTSWNRAASPSTRTSALSLTTSLPFQLCYSTSERCDTSRSIHFSQFFSF